MIKSFFKLTQKEKKSSVYFVLIIVLVFLIKIAIKDSDSQLLEVQSVEHEKIEVSKEKSLKPYLNQEKVKKVSSNSAKEFRFNYPDSLLFPQELSAIEWVKIGFSKGQAKGLVNYFNAIGWVSSPDEVQNIYMLNEAQKDFLVKNIKYQKKDFNLIDNKDLIKIKGIGAVYGSRIQKRRGLLGGFNNYEQLKEVYGLDSTVIAAIKLKTEIVSPVRRIQINSMSFDELYSHPYISKLEAKKIIGKRSEKRISNVDELFELITDSSKVLKLNPYLSYD